MRGLYILREYIKRKMNDFQAKYKMLFFSVVILFGIVFLSYLLSDTEDTNAAPSGPIATVPRATYYFSTEVVGASAAHIAVLNSPSGSPDYKWQFLDGAGGVRFLIDRKQGAGWEQIISQIQVLPEYKKQSGPPGNFIWNTYGLNGNTTGGNVLREWDRQNQPDGSVQFVRTSEGSEEGIMETLTETWTVPVPDGFEVGSPKATYQMTQNRGIVLDKGVREGAWRVKWALSGISDIVSDNTNITDPDDPSGPWPIRTKAYSNGEFTIDVNDFDNAEATSTPLHTYSEIGANNKAEIVFYSSGTEGTRIVDPAIVTTALSSPWTFRQGRAIFHDGSRFFILYNDTDTDGNIYYKSSTDGTTWSATSTLVSDQSTNITGDFTYFATNMISDVVFDIFYIPAKYRTCTISGSSISCDSGSTGISNNSKDGSASLGRSRSDNYIISIVQRGGVSNDMEINFPVSGQSGDAVNIQTDPTVQYAVNSTSLIGDGILYENSTQALAVSLKDAGGSKGDGYYYGICTSASCSVSDTRFIDFSNPPLGTFGDLIRVNDNDFRFVLINASGDLEEYKFNGSSWASLGTIETTGTLSHPTLFRSLISGDLFVFYTDTSATPDVIYRKQKPLGGSWQNKTQVDASESGDRSLALTQRFEIAATSSAQTRDTTYLTWGYRSVNGSARDISVGNLKLHDLTWATSTANFEIYQSGVLTWDAGTKICGGTLSDDNTGTISCTSGSVAANTEYRIQIELDNIGTSTLGMSGASEYVDHVAVKGGWAGTTPSIGSATDCAFADWGADDGSTTCNVALSGDNVRITNTGTGEVVLGGGGGEGFMYLITTDSSSVPSSDSTSYMDTSIGTTTPNSIQVIENSSKITITGAAGGNSPPSISNLTLERTTVTLTENTYVRASSSLLVTDNDDCSEIASVTATLYLASTSNSGTTCTYDGNDCYTSICVATTTGNTCTASDTTEEYDCGFKIWYTAEATDSSAPVWSSSLWSVSATATDASDSGNATNTSQLVEVGTLNALNVSASIAYPKTAAGADTSANNQTVTVTNTGNTPIDAQISGDVMCQDDYPTCSSGAFTPGQQKFDTSDVTYASLTNSLSATASPATINLNMVKPTSTTTPVTTTLYWGVGIPDATPVGDYTGQNTFTAVADS